MRQLLSISLLFSLILPYSLNIATLVNFKINQDFIAEFLCIDKDEPESTCHGKCQLTKQLSETDFSTSKEALNNLRTEIESSLFLQSNKKNDKADLLIGSENKTIYYCLENYTSTYLKGIYRPPQSHFIS